MTAGTAKTPKILLSVQALRAVAASAVVGSHVIYMLGHNAGYSLRLSGFGESGVDLFFLISGFIMVYVSRGDFGKPGASVAFLLRRAIRIVPMYWLCTTLTVLLLAFLPYLFATVSFNWWSVITSYLFLLSKNSVGKIGTVTQTGWTLCFEVYFYLLFAVCLSWPRKYLLAGLGAIFVAGVLAGVFFVNPIPLATVATNPVSLEFFFGVVIGTLFLNGLVLRLPVAIAAIAIGTLALALTGETYVGDLARPIVWGMPAALILLGAISIERAGIETPAILVALGDSSYSLYLTHPFVLPVLGKIWKAAHLTEKLPMLILALLAFGIALAVGHTAFIWIERPLTTRLAALSRSRRRIAPGIVI